MTTKDPLLYPKTTDALIQDLDAEMSGAIGSDAWHTRKQDTGHGLIRLFGRMAEVIGNRLNQVPDQHFRAFLNAAEIDQLPPRPARTEITFVPAEDGPVAIKVPVGTQIATRPSTERPEIIFETERDLIVIPATLAKCIVIDPVNYSDRTLAANGLEETAFAAFAGDNERGRIVYLADDRVLVFDDETSRRHAEVTFHFRFSDQVSSNTDGWTLEWLYWNGKTWANLAEAGARIEDTTNGFLQNGSILFANLPELGVTEINSQSAHWLACQLAEGNGRSQLPTVTRVKTSRTIQITETQIASAESGQIAIQAGSVLYPVDPSDTFQPLGPQPGALDTFYLRVDEAFSKAGALVKARFDLEGLPDGIDDSSEIDQLLIEWEYYTANGWLPLGVSRRGCPEIAQLGLDLDPQATATAEYRQYPITRSKFIEMAIPHGYYDKPERPYYGKGKVLTDVYTGETFVQFPVPAACTIENAQALISGHYTSARPDLAFRDSTCAFTISGDVEFRVPDGPDTALHFAKTLVGEEEGYWIRARLADGSFNVPQKWDRGVVARALLSTPPSLPPVAYAPVVQDLEVSYKDYHIDSPAASPEFCQSKIDFRWHDHRPAIRSFQAFQPFTQVWKGVRIEDPALYLGFRALPSVLPRPPLPPGQWIQLRVDLDEASREQSVALDLAWEYWHGDGWQALQIVDGAKGFSQMGYVGFFAPQNHQPFIAFDEELYWLRIRPRTATGVAAMPYLYTLRLNTVPAVNAETIENELLGSSNGEPFQQLGVARPPVLIDSQLEVLEPELLLGDLAKDDLLPDDQENKMVATMSAAPPPAPIGTSTTVAATPTPSLTEFTVAERIAEASGHESWVPWRAVSSFYGYGSDSRCYRLDPISGVIQFGNGVRGKIPPAGASNVRMRRYRTHNGAAGNLPPQTITVLRNPSGALGEIQLVTNYVPAAGGLDAETVDAAKRRGPHSLKHRQRPVTTEDFQWITLEADQVARAYCLPARDPLGRHQPGWVSLIIVPESTAAKPIPSKTLLRQVRARLEAMALTNLQQFETIGDLDTTVVQKEDTDQIYVDGPKYVEIVVHAEVVPYRPELGDDVKFAVLRRLQNYLHPLSGGPAGEGWEPGRDVYISEIAAEIENVEGVDHVDNLKLQASGMQQAVLLLREAAKSAYELPAGSVVSSFDGRNRMMLGSTWLREETVDVLVVHGFKRDDLVQVFDADGRQRATGLQLTDVALTPTAETLKQPAPSSQEPSHDNCAADSADHTTDGVDSPPTSDTDQGTPTQYVITFAAPMTKPKLWSAAATVVETQDGRIRLPILFCRFDYDKDRDARMTGAGVQMFVPNEMVSVTHWKYPRRHIDFLPVAGTENFSGADRIFVPDDHLVCAGEHSITMKLEGRHGNSTA